MPVYPSGGTIAQSVGSPGFGPAPEPVFNASGSVRFNPADSAYISFIPSLQGARTTFTWSGWVKRSLLSSRQMIISQYQSASRTDTNTLTFEFNTSDQLRVAGESTQFLLTNAVFRDTSSWYHVQVTIDTTNATTTDRVIVYVNGVRQTTSAYTAPAQNALTGWGLNGVLHYIGGLTNNSLYFGGYLADVNFVDGLALTPSSFTSTDANTGQLVPIQYTGNRGTNGFYLPFSGAALAVDLGQNPKTTSQDYPYWPYNTLLVDTTSTNGQQNNTFLDSSTNNFTITRNGNTTQGNFTPFTFGGGTTQANGYYSGYFDGTGDYLTYPGSTFTGNFTCEFWFFSNSGTATTVGAWISSANASVIGYLPTEDRVLFSSSTDVSANYTNQITSTATFPSRTWTHYALTRSGSTTTLYVNGQNVGTGTYSGSLNFNFIARQASYTPRDFNGYISNFRVTNTVVYTSNFTPTTTPLTAISGTQVLTCQSSQFIDNSTNAFAITTVGNSQPVPTNPFGMTAWSNFFDGTGDYLTVPTNAAFTFDGDFTVEMFANFTNPVSGVTQGLVSNGASNFTGSATALIYGHSSGPTKISFFVYNISTGTTPVLQSSTNITAGVWNHIAVTRSGTTLRLFINGQQESTFASSATIQFSATLLKLGSYWNGDFGGCLSNVRFIKGTAVYTANFTPPTAPLTAISGTSLLTCQSSTFVDNSTNAFTITVNGNTYTLTLNNPFNSPVNSTPPVQGWSAYNPVNAAGEQGRGYITLPTSTNLALGAGNFSIEFWINQSVPAGVYGSICGNLSASAGSFYLQTTSNSSGAGPLGLIFGNTSGALFTTGLALRLNQWHHVVVCRTAGTISCFVDGNRLSSVASTYNFSLGSGVEIFRANTLNNLPLVGWLSNFRIVKGTSPYNAALTTLTVPTGPLQAIAGTQLLALQSNSLVDNSLNRFLLTRVTVAAPGITPASVNSPFIPAAAYSAASNGGTMYFDGTGDYLSIPDNDALEGFAGDFTIEFFVNFSSVAGSQVVMDKGWNALNTTSPYLFLLSGGNLTFYAAATPATGTWTIISGAVIITGALENTWYHVAVSRSGGVIGLYNNGVLVSTTSSTATFLSNASNLTIGVNSTATAGYYFNGYVSGLRIVKGTAVYTTSFVPPVLPPTNISNTSLLLNATNAGIYDATGQNVIETVGNAQVNTAVKKFGESSMSFDGTGDYLVIPTTNAPCQFGTADFTVEGWIYPTIVTATQNLMGNRVASTGANNWDLVITSASKLAWGTTSTNYLTSTSSLLVNTWCHIAVSRVSGTTRMFINGTLEATSTSSINLSANSLFNIGSQGTFNATSNNFNGYMQDVRISKGVGRYASNFTPPAAAFAYNQYDIGNQQWTPTNISVTAGVGQDNLFDSPSDYGTDTGVGGQVRGNYATLNPLDKATNITLSNGNLNAVGYNAGCAATFALTTGKWYWEVTIIDAFSGYYGIFGVSSGSSNTYISGFPGFPLGAGVTAATNVDGGTYSGVTKIANQTTWVANDVIGFAFDADALTLDVYRNNTKIGATLNVPARAIYPSVYQNGTVGDTSASVFNFGQRAFAYTAPSGFKCLVSTNLPTPPLGSTSSTLYNQYMDINLWAGSGVDRSIVNSGNMQPDLVWIKTRTISNQSNWLFDSLRGPNIGIATNDQAAEQTFTNALTAFNANGFSLGNNQIVNSSTTTWTYVGWQFKATPSSVTNTDGSITTTVRANQDSGFSIITYTGTGSAATIGTGLGGQIKFFMIKSRDAYSWLTWHSALTGAQYLQSNSTNLAVSNVAAWDNTVPSTTAPYLVSLGTLANCNGSGVPYIAYAWSEIDQYSKMGTYTGNGSTDGPVVYLGFRPRWVMVKSVNAVGGWAIYDDVRPGYNVIGGQLLMSSSAIETTAAYIDFLSNGFKLRIATYPNTATTYLYVAFAEYPFKYARAI